ICSRGGLHDLVAGLAQQPAGRVPPGIIIVYDQNSLPRWNGGIHGVTVLAAGCGSFSARISERPSRSQIWRSAANAVPSLKALFGRKAHPRESRWERSSASSVLALATITGMPAV